MPNTKDFIPNDRIQAIIYGKSGVGKTHLAAGWPRPRWLDFDRGIATLRNPAVISEHGNLAIDYVQPVERGATSKGVPLTHNAFDEGVAYFDKSMAEDADKFDTWVLDTCTTLSQAARLKAVILLGTPQFKGMSQTHKTAQLSGLIVPKQADYGAERSMVEQFIRRIKDSGKHVVILAHEKEVTDDNGNLTAIVPLLTGQSSEVVSGMFDEVWRLSMSGVGTTRKRVLKTETDTIRMAKSRYGLPDGTQASFKAISSALGLLKVSAAA